jgi:MFS family permease
MVCMYVLVAAAYPESLQPKVFGLISASWVLPSLIGPPIAGLLATQIGWRAPFLAVLPLLPAPLWVLASRLRTVRARFNRV